MINLECLRCVAQNVNRNHEVEQPSDESFENNQLIVKVKRVLLKRRV